MRFFKDLLNNKKFEISKSLQSQFLDEYYFLFYEKNMENQKGGQKSIIYDKDCIPLNPTYIDVRDKKYVYFPITIGQVGLAVFHTYLKTNSEKDKNRFLIFVEWFYEDAKFYKKPVSVFEK